MQTKPHYSGSFAGGNPNVGLSTQLHELAHQWFGNSVTLATWADIWFNEGWANWTDWYWSFLEDGGDDPAAIFDELYADTPPRTGETAPAILDGDPANLFAFFPTYQRGAMTLQGYREIVGDDEFFDLGPELLDQELRLREPEHSRVHRLGEGDHRGSRVPSWGCSTTTSSSGSTARPSRLSCPRTSAAGGRGLSERLGLDRVELRLADRPGVEQLLRLGDLARRAAGGVTDVLVHRRPLGLGLLE